MPHTLELINGDCITPMSIYDLMDTIEEYMGIDVRQYLEEYLEGEEPEEVTPEEHFREVLETLEIKVLEIERSVGDKRTDRKTIQRNVEAMKKMFEREHRRWD